MLSENWKSAKDIIFQKYAFLSTVLELRESTKMLLE